MKNKIIKLLTILLCTYIIFGIPMRIHVTATETSVVNEETTLDNEKDTEETTSKNEEDTEEMTFDNEEETTQDNEEIDQEVENFIPDLLNVGQVTLAVGANQEYQTLNMAMEEAKDGDIIIIAENVSEANPANPITIDKSVIIKGAGEGIIYTVTNWAKTGSPLQILADGVVIEDLQITVTAKSVSEYSAISVYANGLMMNNVTIPAPTRMAAIINLNGYSASFEGVTMNVTTNMTGIYSEISTDSLALYGCNFTSTTATSTAISLPSPEGLVLNNCDFKLTNAKSGIVFTMPSNGADTPSLSITGGIFTINAAVATPGAGIDLNGYSASFKDVTMNIAANMTGIYSAISPENLTIEGCSFNTTTATSTGISLPSPNGLTLRNCNFSLTGSGITSLGLVFTTQALEEMPQALSVYNCVFDISAVGTGIDINGYNGNFTDCEFTFSKAGKGVVSKTVSQADLDFINCYFIVEAANAVCIDVLDINNLTIDESTFTINAKATGINISDIESLAITDSIFIADAASAECIIMSTVKTGNISGCTFTVTTARANGLRITDADILNLMGNTYNLYAGSMIIAANSLGDAAGDVTMVGDIIKIDGTSTIIGLTFEHLNSLKLKNTVINTSGVTSTKTCIKANHIKFVDIDEVSINLESNASGIVINDTAAPPDDPVKINITNTTANIEEPFSRAIRIFYADGVLVEHYKGTIETEATNSLLLLCQYAKGVVVRNNQFDVFSNGSTALSLASDDAVSEKSNGFAIYNNNFDIRNKANGITAIKANHNVAIYDNELSIRDDSRGITIAYGRNNQVYNNTFVADKCVFAIVSDGVDEDSTFELDKDKDIYTENGDIIDDNRNQIYENTFIGSYEVGIYVTNNGDVVRDNDFTNATFDYVSIPGREVNAQIYAGISKDLKIKNNKFAKARSKDHSVINLSNGIISELLGNKTRLVGDASQVLFVQGTTSKAVSIKDIKIPEEVLLHNATNLIDSMTPMEIVHKWENENSIYKYILKLTSLYPYSVEYYYNEVLDESKTFNSFAAKDSRIDTYPKQQISGYSFNKAVNVPLVVSEDPVKNIMKIYYEKTNAPTPTTPPTTEQTTTEQTTAEQTTAEQTTTEQTTTEQTTTEQTTTEQTTTEQTETEQQTTELQTVTPPVDDTVTENTGKPIPDNLIPGEQEGEFVWMGEDGVPLGYFIAVHDDDGDIIWIEVDKYGVPLGSTEINEKKVENEKSNPKTSDNSKMKGYFLSVSLIIISLIFFNMKMYFTKR